MAKRTGGAVLRTVRSVSGNTDVTDRELLTRYTEGDESAFTALVGRHGGMVLGVCRRVLPTVQDAEDATQAVFLILSRKAGVCRWQPSVANWLYTAARQIASRANRSAKRRVKRETRTTPPSPSTLDQMTGREAFAALDTELDRLPPIYREALVLCYLEGLNREEAAARLGLPAATMKMRLERGRKRLADALTKRGIVLGAGLLAVAATSPAGASPSALIASVLSAVNGTPSPTAMALAQGAAVNGFLTRTELLALVGLVAVGFGLAAVPAGAGPQSPKPAQDKMEKPISEGKSEAKKADEAKERTIRGKVVGPDGKAVQAELHLFWNRGWVNGRNWTGGKTEPLGKTAADGTFKVTVPLRERGAFLVAQADGLGLAFMMPATNTPAEVTFKLVKDVPVKGRVVDGAGKPIAGATVRLEMIQTFEGDSVQAFLDSLPKRTYFREHPVEPKEWVWHPADGPFRTKTDADGRFELTGIGGERLASIEIKAAGREDAEVHVVTRAGLDVKPFNEATLSLQPKTGEKLTWDSNPILSPAEFILVLATEKPVHGRVTDAKTGKPRAGVEVLSGSDNGVTRTSQRAITDADGRYELHGLMKLPTYTVSVMEDLEAGYLSAQVEVKDSVGHEPVVADLACQKGVIVTGTVREKATGKPVPNPHVRAHVLAGNSFAERYPSLDKYTTLRDGIGNPDGTFRVLVIPGPVLLTGGDREFGIDTKFAPPKADPNYPDLFTTKGTFGERLSFYGFGGGQGGVDGNWCKVLNAKDSDTVLKQDVELEPVTKKLVKVVDVDGKPAKNARTTGFTRMPWHYAEAVGDTDAVPVFDLLPKEKRLVVARLPEKKQVGAAQISDTDANPVIKLGTGGMAKGRVVDEDGKPAAGVTVKLYFDRREVAEIYSGLNENRKAVTDADGKFEFDELLPGYEFRFLFSRGRKQYGPEYQKAPVFQIGKHGEVKNLDDLKLGPAKDEE